MTRMVGAGVVLGVWMLAGTPNGWAQSQVPGKLTATPERNGNVVTLPAEHAVIRLEFCTPAVVRVRARFDGVFRTDEHIMVVRHTWPAIDLRMRETGGVLHISTSRLTVRVHKAPFRLEFVDTVTGRIMTGDDAASAQACLRSQLRQLQRWHVGSRRGRRPELRRGAGPTISRRGHPARRASSRLDLAQVREARRAQCHQF